MRVRLASCLLCVTASPLPFPGNLTGPPQLFIAGVPKAGTTALAAYLTGLPHAQVCGGRAKEYHYFTFHHKHSDRRGLQRYLDNFASCAEHQLTMDASPSTSSQGMNPLARIRSVFSAPSFALKQFVLVLREPIDRMLSWYNFERVKVLETAVDPLNGALFRQNYVHLDSFREYYAHVDFGVKQAFYVDKLRYFAQHVRRGRLLVLSMDTLLRNASDTLRRTVRFLGLHATAFELPLVNDGQTQLQRFNLTAAAMQCEDYRVYRRLFDEKNEGLEVLINDAPERPPEEPPFPPFVDRFRDACSV